MKKNGHARPFGFLSRLFTDEELALHEQVERLQRVSVDLREIRLAVERGELCAEDLDFDLEQPDEVEPTGTQPEKP